MTTAANLVLAYEELYERQLHKVFILSTILNLVFGIFTFMVTFSALQSVYRSNDNSLVVLNKVLEDKDDEDEEREREEEKSYLIRVLESYTFRTVVALSHSFMSLLNWLL